MKTIYYAFLVALLLSGSACSSDSKNTDEAESLTTENSDEIVDEIGEGKRYGIRTAKYTTRTTQVGAPAEMDIQSTVYFDNYGLNEFIETTTKVSVAGYKSETRSFSLRRGTMMYNWSDGQNAGTKMDVADMADKNINYEDISEEMKAQFKYKELGHETILGKDCLKISMDMQQGSKVEVSTWKGLPMRSVADMMSIKATIEVTSLDENPGDIKDKLAVPEDISFAEMSFPGKAK